MAESNYERGLRGGDFIISSDPQAWQDWKDGHDAYLSNIRAREREQDAQDDALIAISRPSLYTFPTDLVRAIEVAGHKINKINKNLLSYYVTIGGKTRLIIASDADEYIFFVTRTRFQFDTETDFSRDILYKALRFNDRWYETYFVITKSNTTNPLGYEEQKWILSACNDKWKGILNDSWLPTIHTQLFGLCADLEED